MTTSTGTGGAGSPTGGGLPAGPEHPRAGRPTTPDVVADILREAWRPDVAAPVVVHVRPELHRRMRAGTPGDAAGELPVVVDDDIPGLPGYEIHRVPPAGV